MLRVDFGPISETVYIDIILNTIIERYIFVKLHIIQMSFHISKINFDIFIHCYAPSIATGFPMQSIFL